MSWETGAPASLSADEIHVWRLRLIQSDPLVSALRPLLSADEQVRADRFYFERDRRSYTVVRGVLRRLLAGYLGCAPEAIAFGYRDKGKPYLVSPSGPLDFNVSHSGDYALLAFTHGRQLGVDVELRRAIDDLDGLAEVSFSPAELAVFRSLPADQRVEGFFACWSRKEAFIKATGEGVRQLAEFDVSLRPGQPAQILAVRGPSAATAYTMYELPALDGHAAALVLADPPAAPLIRCYAWTAPA
ncbi:MAG TPA: 4'-phosphopantetheinyl transferase superfamily protein [Kofleriaceae bacterium]